MIRLNRRQVLRATALWVIASHVLSLVPFALANPEGGSVVGGVATIDQSTAGLTSVRQGTDRAIINWRSFSNGASERIQFIQPGASSAIVNRVTGNETSVINGALEANGRVFLLNPNGVLFGKGSQINVNGLTASTLDLDNNEFMSGATRVTLRQDPTRPLAAVVNKGDIRAGRGGVTLVAPLVHNEGSISTTGGGTVNMGAGTEAVVSVDEENLMQLKVRTSAERGSVTIDPEMASELLDSVVNNSKFVEAGSVRREGNAVILGNAEGIAMNSGTIRADGSAGVRAGTVKVDSTQLTVAAPQSSISANGVGEDSDGGVAGLFSHGNTIFAPLAKLEARGGTTGNGGFLEVSASNGVLNLGDVDTRAPGGRQGQFKLDPDFLVITRDQAGAGQQDAAFAGTDPVGILSGAANTNLNTVTDGKINQQLIATDVILEATGYIRIGSGVAINLAGNRSLYLHVLNTISTPGITEQIKGPDSGTAQITNLLSTNSGKIVMKVDSGMNAGKVDLTNVALDGAAGGVFIDAPGTITLDQVRANGSGAIINVQTTSNIVKADPSVSGFAQQVAGTQVYLKANGIGSTSTPLLTRTSQLLVNQIAGGATFLSNSGMSVTASNLGGAGSYSLKQTTNDATVGTLTVASKTLFGVTFAGASGNGLSSTGSTVSIDSAGSIGTANGATITAQGASLTAVNGITSGTPLAIAKSGASPALSLKNTGANPTGVISLTNVGAVTLDALNTAPGGAITFSNAGDLTIGAGNVVGTSTVSLSSTGGSNLILAGAVTAGSGSTVFLNSAGSITGAGLVTGARAEAQAVTGIGTTMTKLQTAVGLLNLKTTGLTNADIFALNTGTATVAAVSASGSVSIAEAGGTLTVENVVDSGVTAGAGKTVSLVNTTAAGDIVVKNAVTATGGQIGVVSARNVDLRADVATGGGAGTLVDLVARAGTVTQTTGTVTAETVVIAATAGIGSALSRVSLATKNLQLGGLTVNGSPVANGGDAFLANSGAALTVSGSSSGAIDLAQSNAALTVGSLTAGLFTPAGITVTGTIPAGLSSTGGTIALSTVGGTPGGITVGAGSPVSTSGQSIGLVSGAGLTLAGDVTTGSSSGVSSVTLVTKNGAISGAGTVTAGNVAIAAAGNVGATNARLKTSTSNLQLGGLSQSAAPLANFGNRLIENSGANLIVAGSTETGTALTADVDIVELAGELKVDRFLTGLGAFTPAAITSGAQVGLSTNLGTETVLGETISLVTQTSGNVVIASDVVTKSGNIGVVAAGAVQLGADVSTTKFDGTTATLIDIIAQNGSITRSAKTVIADNVALSATGGIGTNIARVQTKTSNLRLGALSVNGTEQVNGGSDYLQNATGIALTLAAKNTSGAVDVVADNAALTVGSLSIGGFTPAGGTPATAIAAFGPALSGVTTVNQKIALFTKDSGTLRVASAVSSGGGAIGVVSGGAVELAADVTAGTGAGTLVDVIANGTITRDSGALAATVRAENVVLSSSTGIGVSGTRVRVDAKNLQLGGVAVNTVTVNNVGDGFVDSVSGGALTLAGVSASTGSGLLDVTHNGALTIGQLTLGDFTAPGNNSVTVVASQQTGLGVTGATKNLSLVTTGGDVTVSQVVTSTGGNIGVVSSGKITLAADVSTGSAANGALLDLIARGGVIERTGATATARSGNLALSSSAGIGSATARVLTAATNIQLGGLSIGGALTNTGDDFLANSGAPLTVAGLSTGDIDITQSGASLTVGEFASGLGTFAPAGVTTGIRTGLTASTGGSTPGEPGISLVTLAAPGTPAPIVVGKAVTALGGKIGVVAATPAANGVAVTLADNLNTGATGQVDVIAQDGRVAWTNGTITSGAVGLAAKLGIGDPGTARVKTATGMLKIGGLLVNDVEVVNGGDDFIANSGVALTVAGKNANGVIDVSQTGAALTIGTLAATVGEFLPAGANSAARVTTAEQIGLTTQNKQISLVTLGAGNTISVASRIDSNGGNVGLISRGALALGADVKAGAANGTGLVDLIAANGAITRTAGSVTAGSVAAAGFAGIGAETARLETSTSNLQLGGLTVTFSGSPAALVANRGNIFVNNTGAALTVAGNIEVGDIDVTQQAANLTVGLLSAGGFNASDGSAAARVASTAQNGVLNTSASDTVSLVTVGSGTLRTSNRILTNDGAVGLVSAQGVVIAADVDTGTTAGAGTVAIAARNGSITRADGTVRGTNVALTATTGIGTAAGRVITSTPNLRVGGLSVAGGSPDNGGDDFLENVGSIATTLAAANTTGSFDLIQRNANLSIGTLAVGGFPSATGHGPVTITAGSLTGATTLAAGKTISLVTLDSGNVLVNGTVSTNGGSIGVIAQGGVVLANNVTTGAAAGASTVDLIAKGGTITRTAGTVTAGNVALAATGGIGASGARVATATSNLQLGNLSVDGAAVANGGDDFLANSGAALTLAAVNASGAIDVLQTGADLTSGTLAIGAFAPAGASSAARVTSASTTGATASGAGKTIALVTQDAGSVNVAGAVRSNGGNIGLVAANGVALANDVSTGGLSAGTVDLVARGGAISRTGGSVTANGVAAAATGGIGSAGARLATSTQNLQIGGLAVNGVTIANAGDDFFDNSGGPLTLAGASLGRVDVTHAGGPMTLGSLAIGAFAPAAITAAAQGGVTSTQDGGVVSLATSSGDVVFVNQATSATGQVIVAAAGNLVNASGGSNVTATTATLTAGLSIGSTAAPLGVTAATLIATAGGSVDINSFSSPTRVTGTSGGPFTLTQLSGDLLLDTIAAGGPITLDARTGSILDGAGGTKANLVSSSGLSRLTAAGTIGGRGQSVNVNVTSALEVSAGGTDGEGDSVNINGTISPEHTLRLLGTFPGQAVFNGRVISGPELRTFQASPSQVDIPAEAFDLQTVQLDVLSATSSAIFTAEAFQQDDFIEEDPGSSRADLRTGSQLSSAASDATAAEDAAEADEAADDGDGADGKAAVVAGAGAAGRRAGESAEVDASPDAARGEAPEPTMAEAGSTQADPAAGAAAEELEDAKSRKGDDDSEAD